MDSNGFCKWQTGDGFMDDPDIPDNFYKLGILAKLIAASRASPNGMISSLYRWLVFNFQGS